MPNIVLRCWGQSRETAVSIYLPLSIHHYNPLTIHLVSIHAPSHIHYSLSIQYSSSFNIHWLSTCYVSIFLHLYIKASIYHLSIYPPTFTFHASHFQVVAICCLTFIHPFNIHSSFIIQIPSSCYLSTSIYLYLHSTQPIIHPASNHSFICHPVPIHAPGSHHLLVRHSWSIHQSYTRWYFCPICPSILCG